MLPASPNRPASAPLTAHVDARLAALGEAALLDTPAEPAFDRLTRVAAHALGAPVALVSLVDADRQFFKSSVGLPEPLASTRETALKHSLCRHVVAARAPLVIDDAQTDPRVRHHLEGADVHVGAYLGVPLATPDGHVLGTLCAVDAVPRAWTAAHVEVLTDLAAAVMDAVAQRAAARDAEVRARTLAERERALAASERRFRAVTGAAQDGIVAADAENRVTFWNPAAEAIFGWTAGEMLGRPLDAIMPERFRARHAAGMARYAATGERRVIGRTVEVVGLRKDGTEFPLEISLGAWADADGPAFSAVLRDVTARRAADAERDRLAAILDATTDPVSVVDPEDGRVTYLNRAGRRLLGYAEAGDLDGLTVEAMHPPGVAEGIRAAAEPTVLRDGSWRGETALRARDGRVVPVSQVILAHRAADGTLAHVSSVMRDISAERAAAAGLEREREFLRAVLESLAEGIVACDAEGRLTLFNGAIRAFHGLPADVDLPPERWAEHYSLYRADGETPLPADEAPLVRALRDGALDGAELCIGARGQPMRLVTASGRRFTDGTGRVLGAVVAMHDVTEQRAAEGRKSEFVTTVSHELRTPLTAIRGSLGLLEAGIAGPLPDKAAGLVRMGVANADRLIRLVTDVLDLDKIAAGKLEYDMAPQRPADLVRAAADGIAGMAAGAHVEVVTRVRTARGVVGDRDRLLQVLTNLLSNAVKFSSPHAAVVLGADEARGADGAPLVRLSVENYGPGIPPDQLGLLFQKFRQLGVTNATRRGGTGLGLAITKAIVEQHGGWVGVESEPGGRTVFWCDLPAR